MSVFFVDGFDVGQGGNSLVQGVPDWGGHWTGGTFGGTIEFVPGMGSVGAWQNGGGLGGVHNGFVPAFNGAGFWDAAIATEHRVGFVLRSGAEFTSGFENAWSHVFVIFNMITDDMILLEVAGNNRVRVCLTDPTRWSGSPAFDDHDFIPDAEKDLLLGPVAVPLTAPLGVQLEVYVNWVTGRVELRSDSQLLATYSGPNLFQSAPSNNHSVRPGLYGHRVNGVGGRSTTIDHLYASTTPLHDGVNTVWHAATVDTFGDGFRPMFQIGGTRYYGPVRGSVVPLTSFPPAANVIYWPWDGNPAGGEWTTAALDSIEQWGFCYGNVSGPNDYARSYTFHLMVLEVTSGRPRVRMIYPGGMTTYSGPWEKSDPSATMNSHVDVLPRRLVEPYLQINDDGCLFWDDTNNDRPMFDVGLSFAEEFDTTYHDWRTITGGEDFQSYFISGYKVHGEGNKTFQSNYVTFQYQSEDGSSAFVQGVWDYSLRGNTGRWGSSQQIMRLQRPDTDYKHQQAKLKIRGHGTALQFRVVSETAKPFMLNGWTVYITGNQVP